MLDSIIQVNTAQKRRLIDKVIDRYSKDAVKGMHFAIWGLAFKPNTDDIRETPAYDVIDGLLKLGASISAYDPHAIPNMKKHRKPSYNLTYAKDALAALKDASALLIVTEWDEFKDPDFRAVAATMDEPVIFDGRNIYDPKTVASHGIEYQSIGRIS
jgi:UDPglucose 6-dehydrogenase